MPSIPAYEGYIFDLDGTIYLGDTLLPGVHEVLASLRSAGRRVAFLSNNPTYTRLQYAEKLNRLAIPADPSVIVNSSYVLVQWLLQHAPGTCLFVAGEQPLIDDLAAAGFVFSEHPGTIEFVVASFDRTFTYHKLQVAFDAIRAGARLIATNADRYCPVPGGGQPDAAAIIAAIEACTNTRCEVVVGKPSPFTVQAIGELLAVPMEQCLMIGDRLETDIAMGARAGMATALVLTGSSRRVDLAMAQHQPDYILDTLLDLLPD
ncbi:MAG: HAD-IIA family hydrolase [Chloroflexales bacterium]|nr:HAD-IIA family hydrolase [Chloroflexales bacterium]